MIVCSSSITLADEFYEALCETVHEQSGCTVRLDLLPRHRLSGLWGGFARRWHLRRLQQRLQHCGHVKTTIVLSRIGGSPRELVIGFAGPSDELPTYAKPIELAA